VDWKSHKLNQCLAFMSDPPMAFLPFQIRRASNSKISLRKLDATTPGSLFEVSRYSPHRSQTGSSARPVATRKQTLRQRQSVSLADFSGLPGRFLRRVVSVLFRAFSRGLGRMGECFPPGVAGLALSLTRALGKPAKNPPEFAFFSLHPPHVRSLVYHR
jgi:hypothetical protein